MSEMGELFSAWKELKKEKKNLNKTQSKQILIDHSIPFDEKNSGLHLVLHSCRGVIDFWPSTGKWIHRHSGIPRRGVFRLLAFLWELNNDKQN